MVSRRGTEHLTNTRLTRLGSLRRVFIKKEVEEQVGRRHGRVRGPVSLLFLSLYHPFHAHSSHHTFFFLPIISHAF